MIYVPSKEDFACYVVQSEGIIRAYSQVPSNNRTINYRDYYINSSYIYKDGTQQFNQYTTLPTCLNSLDLTSDVYYRLDLDKILVIFTIISFFGIFIPIKIFSKLFKRGGL